MVNIPFILAALPAARFMASTAAMLSHSSKPGDLVGSLSIFLFTKERTSFCALESMNQYEASGNITNAAIEWSDASDTTTPTDSLPSSLHPAPRSAQVFELMLVNRT
ncbi:hypothetical protein FOL47_001104 [Perkinsus chesapeaki]|uniref:Secreted protein n=1 Tax=Perkinsus chesapeaki TaxID=330153 RepID=A0A7J6KV92_PERCH|nr:hypothetical protein FOL47_001104 [Perkinsus chesapeaki]